PPAQGLALDELEHRVRGVAGRSGVVECQDVGVAERGERPRCPVEAPSATRIGGVLGGKELQGDVAPESAVAGPVHLSHAARPDEREHLVGSQPAAAGKRHLSVLSGLYARASARLGGDRRRTPGSRWPEPGRVLKKQPSTGARALARRVRTLFSTL